MNKWRLWLGAGMGEVVSQELLAATAGLDGREMRHARRLVRRGETAEDVVVARYAVAFARQQKRRLESSSMRFGFGLTAALGGAGLASAGYLLSRSENAQAATVGAIAIYLLIYGWRTWQTLRNVDTAERLNREYLRRWGSPYVPGGSSAPVGVPALAMTCSFALHLAVAVLTGGVLILLFKDEPLSLGRVLSAIGTAGAVGPALGAGLGVYRARSRHERPAAVVEYR